MKQSAARLNVDESRVAQLHAAALVRLKSCLESMLLPRRAVQGRRQPVDGRRHGIPSEKARQREIPRCATWASGPGGDREIPVAIPLS